MSCRTALAAFCIVVASASGAQAQEAALTRPYPADECPSCAEWNRPHRPVHLFGNTFHVGTHGLGSILVTSPEGHVLIDGGLPDSAPLILANIRALGFDPADVKVILNSHAHYDHAGGIAALQRATGARVLASRPSVRVLNSGVAGEDDPQHGVALAMPRVPDVGVLADDGIVRVGPLELRAHATAGHTPGGTSWSWRVCEGERCLDFVYADSQTPISDDGFHYSDGARYPAAVADFRRGHALLEQLPCDVLITPHPGASALWDRAATAPDGLVDAQACRRYAETARRQLETRLEREQGASRIQH
jgi:metallo-beta-lactamase class B